MLIVFFKKSAVGSHIIFVFYNRLIYKQDSTRINDLQTLLLLVYILILK